MIIQVGRSDWYDWKIFDMFDTEIEGVTYFNSNTKYIETYLIAKGRLICDGDKNPILLKLKVSGSKAVHRKDWKNEM